MTLVRTLIALLLGPWLAVQCWALQTWFQFGTLQALGAPWLRLGDLPLYGLWAGAQWAWWWHAALPLLFLPGAALGACVTGGLLWLTWRPQPPTSTPTASAQWASARQRRTLTQPGGVVLGRERK